MTRIADKIQVPALDEAAVSRIERAVVRSLDRAPRAPSPARPWLALGAMAALCAAAATIVSAAWRDDRVVLRPGLIVATLPMQLETRAGESFALSLGDAEVRVAEETALTVHRSPAGEVEIDLRRGGVRCDVAPRQGRPEFRVRSGDVNVTVVGTAFSVARSDTVLVSVERGRVRVRSSQDSADLLAGDAWEGSPHEDVTLAALHAARPAPAASDTTAEARDRPIAAQKRPRDVSMPVDGPMPEIEVEALTVPEQVARRAPPPPAKSVAGDVDLARLASLREREPRAAAQRYMKLALESKKGNVASVAIYNAAYLQLVALDDPRAALKTVDYYDRRFQGGPDAEGILFVRMRAQCELGDRDACRRTARAYLERYPGGDFAELAARVTRW